MALTSPGYLWMSVNWNIMACDERLGHGEMPRIQWSSYGSWQLRILGHRFSSAKLLIYSHNSPIKGVCRGMRLLAQLLLADVRDPMSHIFRYCTVLSDCGTFEGHQECEWMPLWCKASQTDREAWLLSGTRIRKMEVFSVLQFLFLLPVCCN